MTSPEGKPYPLGMAAEGEPVRIVALGAGRGLDQRLAELGLGIGSEVQVVHHQGGRLVVARDAARLALGGGMAMKILVVPVAGTGAEQTEGGQTG